MADAVKKVKERVMKVYRPAFMGETIDYVIYLLLQIIPVKTPTFEHLLIFVSLFHEHFTFLSHLGAVLTGWEIKLVGNMMVDILLK